jgi:two-component system invasion response regulator UvrY
LRPLTELKRGEDVIRIIVVDDHQLVRTGTRRLLDDIPGIEVIADAGSGEEAVELVQRYKPDVVLMDIQMPGIGGLEATRRCIRAHPEVKILAVTIYEDEPYPSKLLKVGAVGYLTKRADIDEMVLAIRKIVAGQRYISAEIAQELALRPFSEDENSLFDQLSSREMQITLMVIMGHKVQEISEKLSLSPKTVNSYRYRVFEKLGVRNDVGLTRMAIKHGIIDSEVAPDAKASA